MPLFNKKIIYKALFIILLFLFPSLNLFLMIFMYNQEFYLIHKNKEYYVTLRAHKISSFF